MLSHICLRFCLLPKREPAVTLGSFSLYRDYSYLLCEMWSNQSGVEFL